MRLSHEFIQLPLLFDVAALQRDVQVLAQSDWQPHHEGFQGNFSVPLISVGGRLNNDFKGPMGCTQLLTKMPYIQQTIASFNEVIGRSRLMGLAPGAEVPLHSDINYHWYKRVRIHVPIITDPAVVFHCGDKALHMQAGEAWIFDSWKYHKVVNQSDVFRVHLVIDICGSSRFWQMVRHSNAYGQVAQHDVNDYQTVTPQQAEYPIQTEQVNTPLVMSPGEMDGLAEDLFLQLDGAQCPAEILADFTDTVRDFCADWRVLWTRFGLKEAGWDAYHKCRAEAFERVRKYDQQIKLANGTQAVRMFMFCMIEPALNPEVAASFEGIR